MSFVRAESGVDPLALRDARIRMALTQHELARLIDVAGGERISRWELGSSAPRPEMLRRLAQALKVDVLDLLDAGGPPDLRRLRTSAGLSARNLAARAHMSAPTYIRWESGGTKRVPASGTFLAIPVLSGNRAGQQGSGGWLGVLPNSASGGVGVEPE